MSRRAMWKGVLRIGEQGVPIELHEDAEIVDLMEVLQRSLAAGKQQAGSPKRSLKAKK